MQLSSTAHKLSHTKNVWSHVVAMHTLAGIGTYTFARDNTTERTRNHLRWFLLYKTISAHSCFRPVAGIKWNRGPKKLNKTPLHDKMGHAFKSLLLTFLFEAQSSQFLDISGEISASLGWWNFKTKFLFLNFLFLATSSWLALNANFSSLN